MVRTVLYIPNQNSYRFNMNTRPIRNEADYDEALGEIDRLMGTAPGTPESDKLEILVTLVERYESEHWAIGDEPATA